VAVEHQGFDLNSTMANFQKTHIVIMGARAVGGYTGGHRVRGGFHVNFVDPSPEHVEKMRREGMRVSGTQGDSTLPVIALHVAEFPKPIRTPAAILGR
jgi:2-dehydropantoate 2-reductase